MKKLSPIWSTTFLSAVKQRHIRIEKSKLLLENRNYSIGEIARAVGYNDQNYFSRIFTKETGLSPTQYRKQREDVN